MADETVDDEVVDEGDETADDAPPPKVPKKPAPKGKPGKPRPGSAKPLPVETDDDDLEIESDDDDQHVTVDRRAYDRKMEKLAQFEASERERKRVEREKSRKDTDQLAAKDWPKAKERLEAQHRTEVEERDEKISAYENRLRSQTLAAAVREGFDSWNEKNPQRKIRPNMAKHLATSIERRIAVDWDDEGGGDGKGDFVAFDPVTNRKAGDMIQEWLRHEDFAGFLEASTQGGAGGRGGGIRPGSGTPAAGGGGAGGDKPANNPFAEHYKRTQAARQVGGNGVRPSVGLSRVGRVRDN